MIIEADNVWKKYKRFDALQGVSLSVPEGSAFALIGRQRSGENPPLYNSL